MEGGNCINIELKHHSTVIDRQAVETANLNPKS